MLLRGHVILDVAVAGWEEAVRAAGRLLEACGDVDPGYTEAMVRTVREMGPYIVVAPGIALPHARPEDGALRTCVGLVRLATPVAFGSEVNDPVDLVIPFGTSRAEEHVEVLAELARFLAGAERVDALRRARGEDDVLAVLRAFSLGEGRV